MPPEIDPLTGKPKEEQQNVQSTPPPVSHEEFAALRQRLDAFEQNAAGNFSPTPTTPSGPTFDDRIVKIDRQIDDLDKQIDEVNEAGKPGLSKLLRERDKLSEQKLRLRIKHEDIDPAFAVGVQTIEQLSTEVTKGGMKYYDIVKKDMEAHLRQLPPEQRMNPQVRQAAYKMAIGDNVDKIMAAQKEEILRSSAENTNDAPNGRNGRSSQQQYSAGVPDPKKVLGEGALQALKLKGVSIDQEYRRRGYDGWEDYWNKIGKEYFGEQEAA